MASQPLRGYRRLPGPARRYLTPSGREISRYEYDSRRARAAGWRNRAQAERFRESQEWKAWRFKIRAEDRAADTSFTGNLMRDAARLAHQREVGADDDVINDPDGPLAQLLTAIGARDPSWQWPVGETPKGVTA